MIRFDLNMEHGEVRQVCFDRLYLTLFNLIFLQKICLIAKKQTLLAPVFRRGIIKNIILSCFNFCESSKWK